MFAFAVWLALSGAICAVVLLEPRWACLGAPLLLPFPCPADLPGGGVTLAMVLGGSLAARMVLDRLWTGSPLPRGAGIRPSVAAWAAVLGLSVVMSMGDAGALQGAWPWFVGIVLYLGYTRYCVEETDTMVAVSSISLAACVQAALGIVETLPPAATVAAVVGGPIGTFVFGEGQLAWRRGDLNYNWLRGTHASAFGSFINAIDFGAFLGFAVSLLLAKVATGERSSRAAGGLALLLWALVLSFKRSAWVGLAGAFLVALLSAGRRVPRWVILGAVVAVLVLLVSPPEFLERLETAVEPAANLGRLYTYMHAMGLIVSHPIFGVGIGHYGQYAPTMPAGVAAGFEFVPTENSYLTIGTELGITGIAAFLWFLASLARRAAVLRKDDPRGQSLGQGVLMAVAWFALASLAADVISVSSVGLLFILAAAVETRSRAVAGARRAEVLPALQGWVAGPVAGTQ